MPTYLSKDLLNIPKDEKYYWDSPDWYYIDTNGKIL